MQTLLTSQKGNVGTQIVTLQVQPLWNVQQYICQHPVSVKNCGDGVTGVTAVANSANTLTCGQVTRATCGDVDGSGPEAAAVLCPTGFTYSIANFVA